MAYAYKRADEAMLELHRIRGIAGSHSLMPHGIIAHIVLHDARELHQVHRVRGKRHEGHPVYRIGTKMYYYVVSNAAPPQGAMAFGGRWVKEITE